MDTEGIRKLTFRINTSILLMVFVLAGLFFLCRATFLVWFSIPTALIYVIGYYLLHKNNLYRYTRLVYFWLTLYMTVTTVCLGNSVGFHLYCLSMIPIIFYTEYIGEKLGMKRLDALYSSAVIFICYLLSTVYSAYAGAVYEIDSVIAGAFRLVNSVIVIGFLIYYSRLMLRIVRDSEKNLEKLAHRDQLTGLFNRHYMITKLEASMKAGGDAFLAMADIDDFKNINDKYGHNAGDYVLRNVSRIMGEVCTESKIARWGGEEFLLLTSGNVVSDGIPLIEKLRSAIENEDFEFEGEHIKVTVTSGLAGVKGASSVDEWVKVSDDNLYIGKNSGKNKVVCEAR